MLLSFFLLYKTWWKILRENASMQDTKEYPNWIRNVLHFCSVVGWILCNLKSCLFEFYSNSFLEEKFREWTTREIQLFETGLCLRKAGMQRIVMDTTQKHLILPCNKAEAPTDFAMHVKFAPQMSVGVIHENYKKTKHLEKTSRCLSFIFIAVKLHTFTVHRCKATLC